jgi:hypothetical protein
VATSVKVWLAILALVAILVGVLWVLRKNDGRNMQREAAKSEPLKGERARNEPPKSEPPKTTDELVLKLPRDRRADEEVAVRVSVGDLPPGKRIIVRLKSGEIVGAITPYGILPGRKAGVSTLPIPDKAIINGEVTLRLEVADRSTDKGRPPTVKEVEQIVLTLLPVTPIGDPEH